MPRTSPDYMSGPHDGDKCGCRHDGSVWTNRCAAAAANDRAESARWAADHIRANPTTKFTTEYLACAAYVPPSNEDLR